MEPARRYRKRVKHLDLPGHVHELTFSCYERLPLLGSNRCKVMLSHAIDRAVERHGFCLCAFVYMPEHVHLLVWPTRGDARVARLLYAIKRPHAWRVQEDMASRADPLLGRLLVRERPGKAAFRFWQKGPGYDRNLVDPDALRTAAEYLHANPVRRGLCACPGEWKWSSWHHYHGTGPNAPDLPTVHGFPPD